MNKNTIISLVFVAALILGLMVWGRYAQKGAPAAAGQNQTQTPSAGTLTFAEKMYDFGTISMKNGNVAHLFKITNETSADVFIKKIVTSCMCTLAYLESPAGTKGPFGMEGMGHIPPADENVKAGESREVRVVYDPNAHGPAGVGRIDRLVMLSDASGKSLGQIEIKANVTP